MGFFKSGNQKSSREGGKTIIAQSCTLNGELHLETSLHVDGKIEGHIESLNDISIGKMGHVIGFISAKTVYLSGRLEGKVHCSALEILEGGCFMGDLITGALTIEQGGRFIGQSMDQGNTPVLEHETKLEQLELKTDKR
ncbi:polymer-forming cytoskeletal protein [Thiomicrospira microaerophila]|uniref:bactofilin family protein n=1 Tax=Thiomicrospira microaerophila TaxID=406020 RepID=UPI00200C86D5|nr:polymer-forming cytoskeletal protein [Thiomicrospira microaerophila]UQB42847.1 polymer-forming cytoskeletal protein [Thiomicrospira microaerophila]